MRHFIIGDIHGCYYTFKELLASLPLKTGDKLVFVGDYIDRGPHSKKVVTLVKHFVEEGTAIALKGNHEDLCVAYHRNPQNCNTSRIWASNGGIDTLESYSNFLPIIDGDKNYDEIIPEDHIDWMENLPLTYETDKFFVCHAGIDPTRPLNLQDEEELMWIRNKFLTGILVSDLDKVIIHGHTPQSLKEITIEKGHVNVDTGCVYDGKLSAYCVEDKAEYYVSRRPEDKDFYKE